MNYLLIKKNKVIDKKWQICTKCWEYKLLEEFEEREKNQNWYSLICKLCTEKEKIIISEEERFLYLKQLDEIFFNNEQIQNNIKILWEKYKITDEDKFIFFSNLWYNKKWLEAVFWEYYRESYKKDDFYTY